MVGARRLPHHEHQQRRVLTRQQGDGPRILPDGLRRPRGTAVLGVGEAAEGIDAAERIDEVAQGLVVAHRARQVLVDDEADHHHRDETKHGAARVVQGVGGPAAMGQRCAQHPPQGQRGQQADREQQAKAEQVTGFARVRGHDVDDHGGVDHDPVGAHEVRTDRGRHQQQADGGLQRGPPGQGAQQGRDHGRDHQAQGQHENDAARAVEFGQRIERTPQGQVGRTGQPQRYQGDHDRGPTAPTLGASRRRLPGFGQGGGAAKPGKKGRPGGPGRPGRPRHGQGLCLRCLGFRLRDPRHLNRFLTRSVQLMALGECRSPPLRRLSSSSLSSLRWCSVSLIGVSTATWQYRSPG